MRAVARALLWGFHDGETPTHYLDVDALLFGGRLNSPDSTHQIQSVFASLSFFALETFSYTLNIGPGSAWCTD